MPSTDADIQLTTNISAIPGIGPKKLASFRRLGIRCVADLILHLPMRYEHELGERSVAQAGADVTPHHGGSANLAVRGEVLTARLVRARRSRYEATLHDGTGTVLLTWFNCPWLRDQIHPGMIIRAWGKAKRHGDYIQIVNPNWEKLAPEEDVAAQSERLRPVYPAGDELASTNFERAIEHVLEPALRQIEDHLDAEYRSERALPELREAYRMAHRPRDEEEPAQGRRRLAYDELLMLQLGVMLKRVHRRRALKAIPLEHSDAIAAHIRQRLPFTLTASQDTVIAEIAADLAKDIPMNRLLQGDVGAGKTAVALYAMLMAVASGQQAALMAPTELLAEQHFATITDMLRGSRVRIELLTGSLTPAQRRAALERIAAGDVDIVIGTHALLTETVRFKSLAVAVIDEQHRFGVHQRSGLRARSAEEKLVAHTLVMTATPIPRTLSLTVFGDLDVSTIHGLPPGRMPIATRHVSHDRAAEVYDYVARRIEGGEQAYIVVPVIDESDSGLKDVNSHLEHLKRTHLKSARLAPLHGRMSRDERDRIMSDFRDGTIDALVATTVIEVGVDVPAATMMIVEHAERFGLAQLHQLRGRVGRGTKRSLCVLIADPKTDDGAARLNAIVSSGDGFEIAEKDLEIRGPGELFGTRQSGVAPFRVADLTRDLRLLQMARRDAKTLTDADPTLDDPRHHLLRRRLLKAYGESLGLADVA